MNPEDDLEPIEYVTQFSRFNGFWNSLDQIIHGAGHSATLEAAELEIDQVRAIAKVDSYYADLRFRIVRTTREVISTYEAMPAAPTSAYRRAREESA